MIDEPIAIVGMACRFPDADTPEAFWSMLCKGHDAVGSLAPQRRFDLDLSMAATQRAGFLTDVKTFDPAFFGISRHAATSLDPQHRLLLEVAWEALEFGGINPTDLRGSNAGVYVGLTARDYALVNEDVGNNDGYAALGNSANLAANRISHFLDFHGPSMSVDAACASSLVCVHLACQALRTGEIPLALAGGVSLILHPAVTISFTRAGMLSPDGCCKSFDAAANGYVRGEGCGLVVLKRLIDAKRDGDVILGEIIGSAVNHNGRISGITNPDQQAQVAVIRRALENARLDPSEVEFIEAHGTGTPAGDPIELAALNEIFGGNGESADRIPVGAVKTNIGHLEAAAGVASLIKTIYCLRTGLVPANLHFEKLNPKAEFLSRRLFIPTEKTTLSRLKAKRTAGINSFGFGGTNSHLVLQADSRTQLATDNSCDGGVILTLSAKTAKALQDLALRFAEYLRKTPASLLFDVCHTANTGRAQLKYRLAIVATSPEVISEALFKFAVAGDAPGVLSAKAVRPHVSFLLEEMNEEPIWPHKGVAFYDAAFDEVIQRVSNVQGESLLPSNGNATGSVSPLQQFAVACATAANWRSWGIKPDNVICTSANFVTAAVIAGFISIEEGVALFESGAKADELALLESKGSIGRNGSSQCQMILREGTDQVICNRTEWVAYHSKNPPIQMPGKQMDTSGQQQVPPITLNLSSGQSNPSETHGPVINGRLERPLALSTLARLFVNGLDLDWRQVQRLRGRRVVGLPSYPFQRKPFWIRAADSQRERTVERLAVPQNKPASEPWGETILATSSNPRPGVWEFPLGIGRIPYCEDHKAAGAVVVPGVVLLEFVLAGVQSWRSPTKFSYRNVSYHRVLMLPKSKDCLVRIECSEAPDGTYRFGIWSCRTDKETSDWSQNISGCLVPKT